MKFLNLTGFKFATRLDNSSRLFINAEHIISITAQDDAATPRTVLMTTNGMYVLEGNQIDPIMYHLTGYLT